MTLGARWPSAHFGAHGEKAGPGMCRQDGRSAVERFLEPDYSSRENHLPAPSALRGSSNRLSRVFF